jgi:hypothetical protein
MKRIGFRDVSYKIITSKNLPLVAHIPVIRNLFIMGIENVLVK